MKHAQIFLLLSVLPFSLIIADSEPPVVANDEPEKFAMGLFEPRSPTQIQWVQSLIKDSPFLPPHFREGSSPSITSATEMVWCGMVVYEGNHLEFSVKTVSPLVQESWIPNFSSPYVIDKFDTDTQELVVRDIETGKRLSVPKEPEKKSYPSYSSSFEERNDEDEDDEI